VSLIHNNEPLNVQESHRYSRSARFATALGEGTFIKQFCSEKGVSFSWPRSVGNVGRLNGFIIDNAGSRESTSV
jgi:hypothetical protein